MQLLAEDPRIRRYARVAGVVVWVLDILVGAAFPSRRARIRRFRTSPRGILFNAVRVFLAFELAHRLRNMAQRMEKAQGQQGPAINAR